MRWQMLRLSLLVASFCAAQPPDHPYPPGCNAKGCSTVPHLLPTWAPTYQMNESTILMTCNSTGATDPDTISGWSYVDFDWSNWKGTGSTDGWAKHQPMDCEELMAKQVHPFSTVAVDALPLESPAPAAPPHLPVH